MKWFVIETQETGDTASSISTAYPSKEVAEQAYHTVLAYASVSEVDRHGAVLISSDYRFFKNEVYDKTSGHLVTISNQP